MAGFIDLLGGMLPQNQASAQPPQYDLSGIQSLMSTFGDTAQGFVDRNLGAATAAGMRSPAYYNALTSGGTGAQNARFEAMYAPNRFEDEVAAALAGDPTFGKAFQQPQGYGTSQDLGGAGMTRYGGSSMMTGAPQQAAGPITDDTISQMMSTGQIDGRASGVSLSPQQTSVALQNRLEDRAAREAFNQRKFTVSPLAGSDPVKVMALMYDAALQEQEMAARARESQEKMEMARWMGQNELDAATQARMEEARQFDAQLGLDKEKMGMLGEESAFERQMREQQFGLDKLRAEREGQLSQKDLLGLMLGEGGQSLGGPAETLSFLKSLGIPLPGGMTAPIPGQVGAAGNLPSSLGSLFGGTGNDEVRLKLKQMPAQEAFDFLTTTGARGKPLSPEQAMQLINEMHPEYSGNTVADPDGINLLGREGMATLFGGPLGGMISAGLSGADERAWWNELFGRKPGASPLAGLSMPAASEMSLSY